MSLYCRLDWITEYHFTLFKFSPLSVCNKAQYILFYLVKMNWWVTLYESSAFITSEIGVS